MHNNFYFLRQVSARLNQSLKGFTIVSCFSQNKDELVMEFNDASRSFFIRADLSSSFSCLTFPAVFHRARKNSVDLFGDLILKKVVAVRQFSNERAFAIEVDDGWSILFKMHGNRSNILLLARNTVHALFKNSIVQDNRLDVSNLDREIDFSREAFAAHRQQLKKHYFTFGERVWSYLPADLSSRGEEESWNLVQEVVAQLTAPRYRVCREDSHTYLTLLDPARATEPSGIQLLGEFDDPLEAINSFYTQYVSTAAFDRQRAMVLQRLRSEIAASQAWLEKTGKKLDELRQDEHYKAWGDLLMANLHAIHPEATSIDLADFYEEGKIVSIKLDPQLSAQKNAERFYRKGKNQQIEVSKLSEGYESRRKELKRLETELATATSATTLKELQDIAAAWQPAGGSAGGATLPYREFLYRGYRIWVGRDARSYDELTLKYSFKEDLWLHVRDDTGSHVLIKHQAGKGFPKDVIERAASLAAFHSKRKTESLCAVIVTPKKFVRKRKGDPAGAVVVDREEVILVKPEA